MDRKELRDLLLGSPAQRKSEIVKVDVNGREAEVEIRVPSMKDEESINKKALKVTPPSRPGGEVGLESFPSERKAWTLIKCAFVPGTEQRVFDPADADAIKAAPVGSWMHKLAAAAEKAISVDSETVEKNSEPTATDNS